MAHVVLCNPVACPSGGPHMQQRLRQSPRALSQRDQFLQFKMWYPRAGVENFAQITQEVFGPETASNSNFIWRSPHATAAKAIACRREPFHSETNFFNLRCGIQGRELRISHKLPRKFLVRKLLRTPISSGGPHMQQRLRQLHAAASPFTARPISSI